MAEFRLKTGTAVVKVDGKNKVLRAGTKNNTIESDENLLKKFPNKFEFLGDPAELKDLKDPVGYDGGQVTEGSGGPMVNRRGTDNTGLGLGSPEERANRARQQAAQQKTGKSAGSKAAAKASEEKAKSAEEGAKGSDKTKAPKLKGEDVTNDFPQAVNSDLLVSKQKDGRYHVYKADGKELSEGPLTKKGVTGLLKKQAKDEE